ncbi:MAG: SDR family NAD(P)-dependent oxidoreductase [Alteromonadaceae bacterium]|nr:SDR family NAD(P)-dependent oxidoreductase [Alteromonadaceae bacterium]
MDDLNLTLITGASEGIGHCFAREFAKQGHDLVLVARNEVKLQLLATQLNKEFNVQTHVIPLDLLESDAVDKLRATLEEKGLQVDILVNNAGVMYVEPIATSDTKQLERLINLNITSLVKMTHAFIADFLVRERGKIINVASIASFIPTPKFATYGASKSFVLAFTEAVAEEVKYTDVDIHCVCPGFTKTNMLEQGKGMEDMIPNFIKVSPESLVKDAYKAISKGKTVYIDKTHNKLLVQCAKHYPRWFVRGVTGFFSRLSDKD